MKKNILIALCGMDGTGKSTIAQELVNTLNKEGTAAQMIHGHQYTTAKKSFGANDVQVEKYRFALFFLTPFAFLDNVLTYWKTYRQSLRQGVIISDRYFYDKVVRLMFYGILPRTLGSLYVKALPRPDLVFFLDADPNAVHERKKEYSLEQYQRFYTLYKFIAGVLNAPLIRTDQPLDKTLRDITKYVGK